MKLRPIFLTLSSLALLTGSSAIAFEPVDIRLHTAPIDHQIYPRNGENRAVVLLSGTIFTPGFETVELRVSRNGEPWFARAERIDRSDADEAPFSFRVEIEAGLYSYDFEVFVRSEDQRVEILDVRDVVSGDVYLVQGQSNAVAGDAHNENLANQSQRRWVRSYGTASIWGFKTESDHQWHLADGEGSNGGGTVGAWALRMGQLLSDRYGIPIGILNGAVGATPIGYHRRNDDDPTDLDTNYGRLLYRARAAGVESAARAMLWYQGEANGQSDPTNYFNAFEALLDDWHEDYPGLEKVYVYQVRAGCGEPTVAFRDVFRQLADTFPEVSVMSTTGAPGHDDCHYYYAGYLELGDRITRLVARDLYDSPIDRDIEPPNPSYARYADEAQDQILLYFRNPDDTIVWEDGSEDDFLLDDLPGFVAGGEVVGGNTLLLHLTNPATAGTISYDGHSMDGPWVTNARGVGLLVFDSIPIEPPSGQ